MTPLEYSEATSSKSNKKIYQKYDQDNLSDYGKVTPLEVAHINIHKHENIPKLDEVHLRLLGPKRPSRIRYTRYKVQVYKYSLALDV